MEVKLLEWKKIRWRRQGHEVNIMPPHSSLDNEAVAADACIAGNLQSETAWLDASAAPRACGVARFVNRCGLDDLGLTDEDEMINRQFVNSVWEQKSDLTLSRSIEQTSAEVVAVEIRFQGPTLWTSIGPSCATTALDCSLSSHLGVYSFVSFGSERKNQRLTWRQYFHCINLTFMSAKVPSRHPSPSSLQTI